MLPVEFFVFWIMPNLDGNGIELCNLLPFMGEMRMAYVAWPFAVLLLSDPKHLEISYIGRDMYKRGVVQRLRRKEEKLKKILILGNLEFSKLDSVRKKEAEGSKRGGMRRINEARWKDIF